MLKEDLEVWNLKMQPELCFYYPALLDKMEKAHSGVNILLYLPDMQFIWANLCAVCWTEQHELGVLALMKVEHLDFSSDITFSRFL